ncbi:hypothetical protein [Streptomyces sp. NPDC054838]
MPDGHMVRLAANINHLGRPPVCIVMWLGMPMAAQAVQDAFAFVPRFVPWDGESPRSFFAFTGAATGLWTMAVIIGWRSTSVRAGLVDGLGLRPTSMRQALRWAAVGLGAAVVL